MMFNASKIVLPL